MLLYFQLFLCLFLSVHGNEQQQAAWLQQKDPNAKADFLPLTKPALGKVGTLKLVAKEDIKEGETVISFSLTNCLNLQNSYNIPGLGEILKSYAFSEFSREKREFFDPKNEIGLFDDVVIRLTLIYLKHNPEAQPEWTSYIKSLPSTFDTPIYWEESDLLELKGSPLSRVTKNTLSTLKKDYSSVIQKLIEKHPDFFKAEVFTMEEFKWSHAVYSSRVWLTPDGRSHLFPLAEIFNLADDSSVKIVEKIDAQTGLIELVASENIAKGEEIVVNNGRVGNYDLLQFWGFVLAKNPANGFEVGLNLEREDRLFGNKKELLEKRGLKDGQTFYLKETSIPDDLLYALRIYQTTLYDFEDVGNAAKNKAISSQNEMNVAAMLIELCETNLKSYETSAKQDKQLLKSSHLSTRQRNAIILRRGEKRILIKTLQKAKSAFARVQQTWDKRTMDIPGTEAFKAIPVDDEIM